MSLFLVNRYLGEEEHGSISKESRSQALLAKLQQKAKEKQRKSLPEERGHRSTEQTEQQDVQTKRKADSSQKPRQHKKRKSEVAPLVDCDAHDEPVEEEQSSKTGAKEKRKKKKYQSGSSVKALPDAPVTGGDGQEDTGGDEKTETETLKQTTEKISAPSGFTVLRGFENKPVQKVHRVLPQWLAQPDMIHRDIKSNLVPISDIPGLSALFGKKLQSNGIQDLFPVQAEVIPAILESAQQGLLIGRGGYKPRDICVSAPTGSGKTLAFVLPVIQVLMERVVCEVRALAVLPTKELAQQVCKVFTSYAEGTPLKVVMLAGQKSFAAEQASLSEHRGDRRRSLADIVVATPGRLVDHINKNSGFSLEHLRFLIIDEADRMIDSMHQSWLSQVVKAVYRSESGPGASSLFRRTEPAHVTAASRQLSGCLGTVCELQDAAKKKSITPLLYSMKTPKSLHTSVDPWAAGCGLSPPQMPLQKLLFSATLTQNPEKLQQLGLHQPRLFSSIHCDTTPAAPTQQQGRFNFPQGLTEYYVPCTLSKKPLLILHFILRMKLSPILCFTNSRETAHRLFLLLQLFGGIQAAEFSSRLSPAERKKTLKEFEQGKIQLLISTDAAARGIDINGVKCVVNYDAPQYIRTYIHRIGRTARAGKTGLAFTFLLGVQEKNFLQMVVEAGTPGIQMQIVKPENLKSLEARYEETLQELANVIKDEKAR